MGRGQQGTGHWAGLGRCLALVLQGFNPPIPVFPGDGWRRPRKQQWRPGLACLRSRCPRPRAAPPRLLFSRGRGGQHGRGHVRPSDSPRHASILSVRRGTPSSGAGAPPGSPGKALAPGVAGRVPLAQRTRRRRRMGSSSSGKRQRGLRVPPARHPDVPLSPGLPTGWADSDSARGRGAPLCPPFLLPVSGSPPSCSPGSFKSATASPQPATLSSPKPSFPVSPKRPVRTTSSAEAFEGLAPGGVALHTGCSGRPHRPHRGGARAHSPPRTPPSLPDLPSFPRRAPRRRTAARAPPLTALLAADGHLEPQTPARTPGRGHGWWGREASVSAGWLADSESGPPTFSSRQSLENFSLLLGPVQVPGPVHGGSSAPQPLS